MIDLKDKFAIGPGFVFAYEGALGNDRTIWTGWIPVDEESVFPNQWRKHRGTSSPLNLEILHYLFRAVREPARRFIRINV